MIATEHGPRGEDIPVGAHCLHCDEPVRLIGVSWLPSGGDAFWLHPRCASVMGRYFIGDAEAIRRRVRYDAALIGRGA